MGGIICMAKIDFYCPYCGKKFIDKDDVYCNRINKNKSFTTKVKCECNNWFRLTANYKSELITWKITKTE
jgi:hypothetical protein